MPGEIPARPFAPAALAVGWRACGRLGRNGRFVVVGRSQPLEETLSNCLGRSALLMLPQLMLPVVQRRIPASAKPVVSSFETEGLSVSASSYPSALQPG